MTTAYPRWAKNETGITRLPPAEVPTADTRVRLSTRLKVIAVEFRGRVDRPMQPLTLAFFLFVCTTLSVGPSPRHELPGAHTGSNRVFYVIALQY